MTRRTASCSCGQLTATTVDDPIRVVVCHCFACQRRTGSAFGVQARFDPRSVEIHGRSTTFVRIGDAGSRIEFSFCPVCGSTVHYTIEGEEDLIRIPVGAFADNAFPGPAMSVYEDRKHAWVTLPASLDERP